MNEIARRANSWRRVVVGVMVLLVAVAGCTSGSDEPVATTAPEGEAEVVLKVSGSGTTIDILSGVASAFEADTPDYRLSILPGAGTGGGVEGIVAGSLDVAAMARPPKDEEVAEGVRYAEFGFSATAIYAHPSVGVADLTSDQIVSLFMGEVQNWSELGGPDLPITVFVRDENDSSTGALRDGVFGETPFPEDIRVLSSQSEMQDHVANTEGSVGWGSWPAAVAAGVAVEPIAVDGVSPRDNTYEFRSPVGLGYLPEGREDVQPLIDWLASENGRAALREIGVIVP